MAIKKSVKKKSNTKKQVFTMICPDCGTTEISENTASELSQMGLPKVYSCAKCGHTSHIFPEVAIDQVQYYRNHILTDLKLKDNTDKVDLSYGRFEVSIMWKFTSIVMFVGGILMLLATRTRYIPLTYPILIIFIGLFMIYITYLGGKNEL